VHGTAARGIGRGPEPPGPTPLGSSRSAQLNPGAGAHHDLLIAGEQQRLLLRQPMGLAAEMTLRIKEQHPALGTGSGEQLDGDLSDRAAGGDGGHGGGSDGRARGGR